MCPVRGSGVSCRPNIPNLNGVSCVRSSISLVLLDLLPNPSSLPRLVQVLTEEGTFHAGDASCTVYQHLLATR